MDVPRDLLNEIKALEKQFSVDTAKLKEITDHFVNELEKGLSVEGGSIVSCQLLVTLPITLVFLLLSRPLIR